MKPFLFTAAALFYASHDMNAQNLQAKTVKLDITTQYTNANVTLNKGDTLFMVAEEDVSLGDELTHKFGRVGLCGYKKPDNIAGWKYDLFISQANRIKSLPHGAMLVYRFKGDRMTDVSEYCSLPSNPHSPTCSNCKMLIAYQDNTQIFYGLNDTDTKNDTGIAKVTMEHHIKASPQSYANQ